MANRKASFDITAMPAGKLSQLAGVTLKQVAKRIYHLHFPTQYLLTSTFLRFQEHYESPKFRGKAFTLEVFMDWYANQNEGGKFSYYEDWAGFNIPSFVLNAFYRGKFDPLTRKEQALLDLFLGIKGRFYIVGTYGNCNDIEQIEKTLCHEIAHGLFYTDVVYRREVKRILAGLNLNPIFDVLRKFGYHEATFIDEAHAYISGDLKFLAGRGVDIAPYCETHKQLVALYRTHFEQNK